MTIKMLHLWEHFRLEMVRTERPAFTWEAASLSSPHHVGTWKTMTQMPPFSWAPLPCHILGLKREPTVTTTANLAAVGTTQCHSLRYHSPLRCQGGLLQVPGPLPFGISCAISPLAPPAILSLASPPPCHSSIQVLAEATPCAPNPHLHLSTSWTFMPTAWPTSS